MKEYQLRVIEEKRELDEKTKRLDSFRESAEFRKLVSPEDQHLMHLQSHYMQAYSAVLGERIAHFK